MSEDQADKMEGVEITDRESNVPLMSADEKRVLELYDRLEELQLEIALLKTQGVLSQDSPEEVSQDDLKQAQQDLLKAKARYQIRTRAIESVLVANPILKAVHAGSNATVIEQDLLPLIEKRDFLSVALSRLVTQLQTSRKESETVEQENIVVAQKNVELSAKMLALAGEANAHKKEDIDDPRKRQQLDELDADLRSSRQRYRIMKGTASATIAGSGIDWSRDPELCEMVMDDDGDDG